MSVASSVIDGTPKRLATVPDIPELQLVFNCARTHPDEETIKRIQSLLEGPLDWTLVLRTAQRQRIVPILYHVLSAFGGGRVPAFIEAKLRPAVLQNARQSLLLAREAVELLELFSANGIQGIPYKGPALAAAVYGDIALRQYGDVDIIVHKNDVPKAMALMEQQGYVCLTTHKSADKDRRFVRPDRGLMVELHWAVTSRNFACRFDVEQLWEGLIPTRFAGRDILFPSPENLLLILCIHGTKHYWERLQWVSDIAEFVRVHENLDWERMFDQAARVGVARMVRVALALASDLTGVVLPEAAARIVASDKAVRPLAKEIAGLIVDGRSQTGFWEGKGTFFMKVRERRFDRLHFAFRTIIYNLKPRPVDEDSTLLPPGLWFISSIAQTIQRRIRRVVTRP
jgi:hypothetical protein